MSVKYKLKLTHRIKGKNLCLWVGKFTYMALYTSTNICEDYIYKRMELNHI